MSSIENGKRVRAVVDSDFIHPDTKKPVFVKGDVGVIVESHDQSDATVPRGFERYEVQWPRRHGVNDDGNWFASTWEIEACNDD